MSNYADRKEHETKNIRMWLNNDEHLYLLARGFMTTEEARESKSPYRFFARFLQEICETHTLDGICFLSHNISYKELNETMRDFTPENYTRRAEV